MLTRRAFHLAALGAALPLPALAQTYPSRVVTIVAPYPPGGQPDVAARFTAEALSRLYPQRFIVENRVGGLGNIGSTYVARAEPDGHTLLVGTVASHGINPSVVPNLTYDAINDFRHVALLAQAPSVFVIHSDVPANTFDEFVAYVRSRPGQLSYASPGVGTLNHLVMETIKKDLGLDMPSVEYRGAGPAFTDVMAGHVHAVVTNIEIAAPQMSTGRVKALAVSSTERAPLLPNVPTYNELGHRAFTSTVWSCLFAPRRTPDAIVNDLNAKVREGLRDERAQATMRNLGIVTGNLNPAEVEAFVRNEIERLGRQVRAVGVRIPQ
jgi:tripartite-type tricarboxylate transporter receptor subunit TctC